jgi:hypothetical protein
MLMPRFVLLEHDHPILHWDFMLESGEALRTWRLLAFPEAGKDVAAEALADHRTAYLDYEGPVSNQRGTVKRVEWGTYSTEGETPGRVFLRLQGRKLTGTVLLEQAAGQVWQFSLSVGGEGEIGSDGNPHQPQTGQSEDPQSPAPSP